MKRQSFIKQYFRCSKEKMEETKRSPQKRKLSLKRLSPKSPKVNIHQNKENTGTSKVISLCSDDEDIEVVEIKWEVPRFDLTQLSSSTEAGSNCSQNTVVYDIPSEAETSDERPDISLKSCTTQDIETQLHNHLTPSKCSTSPSKTFATERHKTPSQLLKSPNKKYFSPAKKRTVTERNVKRNLLESLDEDLHLLKCVKNEQYAIACQGMDEKTISFLTTIEEFLTNTRLHHLLSLEAHIFLNNVMNSVKPGPRLVCRLYWRKEGWYKMAKVEAIANGKDGDGESDDQQSCDMKNMLEDLIAKGIVIQGDSDNISFDDFLSILNKSELMQVCKELNLKAQSKQEAIQVLTRFSQQTVNISHYFTGSTSSNSKRVLQAMAKQAGPCLKLSDMARSILYRLYIIIYLGMDYSVIREKRLEFILLYDRIKRETYPVPKDMELDDAGTVFKHRDEFEKYIESQKIYEDFLTKTVPQTCEIIKSTYELFKQLGVDEMERCKAMPVWLRRYTAGYMYVRILDEGITDLKKDKELGHCLLAVNILKTLIDQDVFRQHKKAEWYTELALVLHTYCSRSDEAAEVLIQGFRNISDESKDVMRCRAKKIATQKNIRLDAKLKTELLEQANKEDISEKNHNSVHIHRNPMDRSSSRGKQKFETRTAQARIIQDAEECCIAHYICTREFTNGEHWEGRIITTIFFLLFWEIIYQKPAGVPGVFLSYYQKYPLDFFTESFFTNRQEALVKWLDTIESSCINKLLKIMQETWNTRPEHEISGINRSIGWDNVCAVSARLGPRGLRAVCERLARNYRHAHSGFPDLTLWNQNNQQLKFVEVKTDSDKPSLKQILWMCYLREHGIQTEFCYVGVNTARQRCRRQTSLPKPKIEQKPKQKRNRKKQTHAKPSATQVNSET